MLSYSDGSEGKSKDSKIAKSSSVDLPVIPFRIMTSEYKSQLEALMMEKFNKLGRGTFGDGSKIYNHGRNKPSLGKVILDLALFVVESLILMSKPSLMLVHCYENH